MADLTVVPQTIENVPNGLATKRWSTIRGNLHHYTLSLTYSSTVTAQNGDLGQRVTRRWDLLRHAQRKKHLLQRSLKTFAIKTDDLEQVEIVLTCSTDISRWYSGYIRAIGGAQTTNTRRGSRRDFFLAADAKCSRRRLPCTLRMRRESSASELQTTQFYARWERSLTGTPTTLAQPTRACMAKCASVLQKTAETILRNICFKTGFWTRFYLPYICSRITDQVYTRTGNTPVTSR